MEVFYIILNTHLPFQFKYQINLDGTVAAYRLPYLLAGGSLVLKQNSPYYEFFYKDLEPMVHYIPFQRDLSDLLEKLEWAVENDEQVFHFDYGTSMVRCHFNGVNHMPYKQHRSIQIIVQFKDKFT